MGALEFGSSLLEITAYSTTQVNWEMERGALVAEAGPELKSGFGTLQFFRSKLLFVLLSKIASSLLSFAPLIKEEGVKIPPSLHSRKSLSYTSKWRFLVSK